MDISPALCICDNPALKRVGASYSSYLNCIQYKCTNCNRLVAALSNQGGSIVAVSSEPSDSFSEEAIIWINSTLMTKWRDVASRIESARKELKLTYMRIVHEKLGISISDSSDKWTKEQSDGVSLAMRDFVKEPAWITPIGFGKQEIPPKIPKSVTVFIRDLSGKFHQVDHAESAKLEVPPDPIRLQHDLIFNEVFVALEETFGVIEKEIVRNEYCGSEHEPWYKFYIGQILFLVGPRKRVFSVQAEMPEGLSVEEIYNLAQEDKTTYYADGDWQSKTKTAKKIEIHAWGKDKLIQYLMFIGQAGLVIESA